MSTTRPFVFANALVLAVALQSTIVLAESAVKYIEVDNAKLPYVEEGSGAPVVFVHGAVSDYRTWNPHRSALAKEGYRAISYTQRYFGDEGWQEGGPPFSVKTHAEDLAEFIRKLGAGPAHVVTWSYAGQVALSVTLDNPDLVKSLFIYEPASSTYVTDPSMLKLIAEDRSAMSGPAVKAVKESNNEEAVRQIINGVSGKGAEYFATQSADVQRVQLDNAPSMPKFFSALPPVAISCEQLGSIKTPTAIVRGSNTRPFYRIVADEAARCTPAATQITVPDATHMWPGEQPAKFVEILTDFLKAQ